MQIVNFAILADHRIKQKESEKKITYLDLARELKKNYETWRWQLCQSSFELLVQSTKDYKMDWMT